MNAAGIRAAPLKTVAVDGDVNICISRLEICYFSITLVLYFYVITHILKRSIAPVWVEYFL